MASLELPSGIKILNPKPIGEYDEFKGVDIDTAKANALAGIPSALRYKGMKVTLVPDTGGVEYWAFIDGILDTDFVNIAEYYNNLPLIDNGLTYDVLSNTIKLGGSLIDLSTSIQLGGKILSFVGNNNVDIFEVVNTNYVNIHSGEFKIESINVSANLPRPIYLHSGEDFTDSGTPNDTFHFPLSTYGSKQRLLSEESFSSIYSYILSGVTYKGAWNATTNTPTIPIADSTNKGYYYVVEVAGTTVINDISDWEVGDWIISNGSAWQKVDNTDAISSFNGSLGAIIYEPQGTTNRITVTGASGLTPTFDIASTYAGQTSITTLGTIGTGTWQGTAIADSYIASATTWNNKVSGSGLSTNFLPKWNGSALVDSPIQDNADTIAERIKINRRDFVIDYNGVSASEASYFYLARNGNTRFSLSAGTANDNSGFRVYSKDYFHYIYNVNTTTGESTGVTRFEFNSVAGSTTMYHTKTDSFMYVGKLNTGGTYTQLFFSNSSENELGIDVKGLRAVNFLSGQICANFTKGIRIANSTATPDNTGAIRYNNGRLEFANGTDWNETSSFEPNIRTVSNGGASGQGNVASGDYIIRVTTTAAVLTLPLISAVGIGKVYKVFSRNVPIQINRSGSDLIDGQVSYSGTGYTCVTLRALGTNDWSIGD